MDLSGPVCECQSSILVGLSVPVQIFILSTLCVCPVASLNLKLILNKAATIILYNIEIFPWFVEVTYLKITVC